MGQRGIAPAAAEDAAAGEARLDTSGQVTLPLGGQDFVLRPSRVAIQTIERQTGRTLFELAAAAAGRALSIEEMAVAAAEMMKAHGAAVPTDELAEHYKGAKPERLADLIYEAGVPKINVRLGVVLMGALNGGYTASGEAKPTKTGAA